MPICTICGRQFTGNRAGSSRCSNLCRQASLKFPSRKRAEKVRSLWESGVKPRFISETLALPLPTVNYVLDTYIKQKV